MVSREEKKRKKESSGGAGTLWRNAGGDGEFVRAAGMRSCRGHQCASGVRGGRTASLWRHPPFAAHLTARLRSGISYAPASGCASPSGERGGIVAWQPLTWRRGRGDRHRCVAAYRGIRRATHHGGRNVEYSCWAWRRWGGGDVTCASPPRTARLPRIRIRILSLWCGIAARWFVDGRLDDG